ncbi:MAG: ABC transporter ATP-binding protein [Planctomycetes bacterium]|nr:ABC transporter ATP-binding protein [Planctomycetota bacterium]
MAVVEAKDVWKIFEPGHVEAVRGATFNIAPGEIVAIMGPSGSGKTTLLMMLGAMLSPTRGEIRIASQSLGDLQEAGRVALRRRRIGFVFQSFNLFPSLTALENVAVPLRLLGARDHRRRAAEELERVGLAGRLDFLPAKLSGGQQQRVAIARALAHGPAVILADEPTGALDSTNGLAVIRLLSERASEKGAAVIVVTHDERLSAVAHRVLRLEDGCIAAL